MKGLFIKNNLEDTINSATDSVIDFPKYINIIDINNNNSNISNKFQSGGYSESLDEEQLGGGYSATSSANYQNGGGYSATSSTNYQNGGGYSATSSANYQNGGGYSATSSANYQNGGGYSETSSVAANGLTNMTYSATSTNRSTRQTGGNNNNNTRASNQNNEYDVNKLLAMLTTESSNIQDSENTSVIENKLRDALNGQAGGAQIITGLFDNVDPSLFNATETEYNNYSDIEILNNLGFDTQSGGRIMAPAMLAFQDLKKLVSVTLKIGNGPVAAKIAGAVIRELKDKKENALLSSLDISNKAKKYFESKVDHFKQMIPK